MRPDFKPEQEVRFAVVMYGGVSLAIYINGVAQELFRLVRATAPSHMYSKSDDLTLKDKVYYEDEKLDETERVYRRLGQMLGHGEDPGDGRVRTRFVVDIISGTSAGGINGVLLALALAQQKDFRLSAKLWREVADIDDLLREEKSFKDLPEATPRDSESLLNGYRLYFKAREAIDDMPTESPDDPWRPAFVEQLDLAVTATDLAGLALPVRLTEERSINERVHRKVFRFSYGTAATTGEDHSDFEHLDLMLGFAARATSSFPFAFEPVLFRDVQQLERPGEPDVKLERFFAGDPRTHKNIAFADGGYLDNKPFSYATEALRSRRADVPVTRKLVYIEPHPVTVSTGEKQWTDERGTERDRPDVIGNVTAAMSLPSHETIREDVAAVARRNITVERLQELGLEAGRALDQQNPLEKLRDASVPVSDDKADELLGHVGPAYKAYRTLRARAVLDDLAVLGAELRGTQPGDGSQDVEREIRNRLRKWIEGPPPKDFGAFLHDYDGSYEQRRLSFLHDRVNDLLKRRERATRMVAVANKLGLGGTADALAAQADGLRKLKLALNTAIDELRRAERAPRAHVLEETLVDAETRERFETLRAEAATLPANAETFMTALAAFLERPLSTARENIPAAIHDEEFELAEWIRKLLAVYDDRFEAYDLVTLPLAYPALGETNSVGIVRISPLDAKSITPTADDLRDDPTAKLAGVRVKHFGGFLDREWRDNDLMWGRLDAAEVIVDTLLGKDHAQRDAILAEAHAAILRQDLAAAARKSLEEHAKGSLAQLPDAVVVEKFREWFTKPGPLPSSRVDNLTARSVRLGSKVLADAAYGRKWPSFPLRAASFVGPGVARVALPASRG
ncbi:MAG TPA: patatin-like protein, partial [Solirubrobacteraceae bacterium]|nr:patatin-like protein [Solirubrobacteraceae bacterium]